MKKISIVIGVLALYSLTFCSHRDQSNITTIIDPQKLSIDTPTIEVVPLAFDNSLSLRFVMIDDSTVVNVKRQQAGNFLDIVNNITGEQTSLFNVGEGPEELLFCDFKYDGGDITIADFTRKRLTQFPKERLKDSTFKAVFIPFPQTIGLSSQPLIIGDSMLILNPYHYINDTEGINQDEPRLVYISKSQEFFGPKDKELLFTFNVTQADLIRNENNGDIWVFPADKSVIEIYNSSLDKKKTIKVLSDVSGDAPVFFLENKVGNKEVIYKGGYPQTFMSVTVSPDKSKLYVPLVGKFITKKNRLKDQSTLILEMNWEGEILKTLYVPHIIYNLSITDSGLYASIDDEEENSILVKIGNETD